MSGDGEEWDDGLKPCPFCGGDASNEHNSDYDWVTCIQCNAVSDPLANRGAAIKAWNTRQTGSWIPVGERLPEMGQPVLVWGCDENPVGAYRTASEHNRGYTWWLYASHEDDWLDGITHWRELPPAPQEKV